MKKGKIFLTIGIIILTIVIIVCAGTYAWYLWKTSDTEETKIVTSVGAATIYYDAGAVISGARLRPTSDKSNGIVKTIQIKTSVVNQQKFDLYLDLKQIDPALQHESFRYALYRGVEDTLINDGNFSQEYLNSNGSDCTVNDGVRHIELLKGETVSTTITTFTLYIWIDGANYINPIEMQNKNFTFTLHASGEDAIIKEGKIPDITQTMSDSLAHSLVSTYYDAEKVDIINNGVIYHYDRANRLMSDISGNLRFYGSDNTSVSDDLKNYIYFNCSDYNNQSSSTCEVWRIIGVFDGSVKIMKNSSIGKLAWDMDKNQNPSLVTYNNDWNNASLQLFLNGKYYNRGSDTSLVYYSRSGGSDSVNINLEGIGIKNDKTRELISETLWYLRGWNSNAISSDQMYDYERSTGNVNNPTWPTVLIKHIGIPYVSDYGYAVDFESCNKQLNGYYDAVCTSKNWMRTTFGSEMAWLMAPFSTISTAVWYVHLNGDARGNDSISYVPINIFPVLHLNSELGIMSGDGSQNTPYQLKV